MAWAFVFVSGVALVCSICGYLSVTATKFQDVDRRSREAEEKRLAEWRRWGM